MYKVQDAVFRFSKNVFGVTLSPSGNLKSHFGIKGVSNSLGSCDYAVQRSLRGERGPKGEKRVHTHRLGCVPSQGYFSTWEAYACSRFPVLELSPLTSSFYYLWILSLAVASHLFSFESARLLVDASSFLKYYP